MRIVGYISNNVLTRDTPDFALMGAQAYIFVLDYLHTVIYRFMRYIQIVLDIHEQILTFYFVPYEIN